jgi:type I restriction enzyme S subunit
MVKQGRVTVTPRLRFPKFRDRDGWKGVLLGDASTPVSQRVGGRKLTPVSISAGIGFVPQAEKFGRDISGNQYALYTLVRDGDFVYNKGNSLKFPQGCVYQLRGWGEVAAPNVFISFRLKQGFVAEFYQYCFERNIHGLQLQKHITSGARSNGLLNVSKDQFFGVEIPTPQLDEQQKVADCLTSLDEVIAAQGRKVEALKAHKRGLMQQLFPREGETRPRLRFPEFRNAPEWKPSVLADVCRPQQWRTISSSELTEDGYPVYGANGFIGRYPSFNHEFETVAVTCRGSTCGEVLLIPPKSYITGNSMCLDEIDATKHSYHFIFHLLKHRGLDDVISGSAQPQIVGQAIKKLKFLLPGLPEQQRIADCLSSLDTKIAAESDQLAALKTHKQGLMQQLFPAPEAD